MEDEGIYEGYIEDDAKNGLGAYLWYNGNFYNGNWENSKITGMGTLFYSNGGILKGIFKDGKLNGMGRSQYPNGDTYMGMWQEGKFHGKGIYYIKEWNQWELGEFENGNRISHSKSGIGKPSSLKIRSKLGSSPSEMHHFFWQSELSFDHYEGELLNGQRHGNGLYVFADGSFYEGQWRDNKPNGLGLFHYNDGKYDTGIYHDGFLNEYGKAQFFNHDIYEGYFHDGAMEGFGLYYQFNTNSCLLGFFSNNRVVHRVKEFENKSIVELFFSKCLIPYVNKENWKKNIY